MLGFTFRAIHVLQFASIVASVLSAYVLFTIARRYFRSLYLAWSLTFLFAFAATWWKFSVDADAYILSVLFLLICFALIMPGRKLRPFLLVVVFSRCGVLSSVGDILLSGHIPGAVLAKWTSPHFGCDEICRWRIRGCLWDLLSFLLLCHQYHGSRSLLAMDNFVFSGR